MTRILRRLAGTMAVLALALSTAAAQQPQTLRIRGTVEKINGDVLTVKTRESTDLAVTLADDARITALTRASLADIRPNAYVGVAAIPGPDGTQRAASILIFLESQRGVGEGHRDWDLQPRSTMTNATVESVVANVTGSTLTLKYKDGEQKIVVAPETVIVTPSPGQRSEIKPGTKVMIFGATRQADGSLKAPSISFGRDGLTPSM